MILVNVSLKTSFYFLDKIHPSVIPVHQQNLALPEVLTSGQKF